MRRGGWGHASILSVIPNAAPDTEEAEVEWFYEYLQDLIELTTKKKMSFSSQGTETQK